MCGSVSCRDNRFAKATPDRLLAGPTEGDPGLAIPMGAATNAKEQTSPVVKPGTKATLWRAQHGETRILGSEEGVSKPAGKPVTRLAAILRRGAGHCRARAAPESFAASLPAHDVHVVRVVN